MSLKAIRERDAVAPDFGPYLEDGHEMLNAYRDRRVLLEHVDALEAAAKKVTYFDYCDDDEDVQEAVADLRKLLEGER